MGCNGKCCHLNHVEHSNGSCCRHDTVRVRYSIPLAQKLVLEERARQAKLSMTQVLEQTLTTFGGRIEVEPPEGEMTRLDVTLPLYLVRWAEARDGSRYIARRIQASIV